MKIKDTNIFNTVGVCFWKKTPNGYNRNISVIQLSDRVYKCDIPGLGYIFNRFFFLLEAFWLDVATSRDEWRALVLVHVHSSQPANGHLRKKTAS